MTNTSGLSSRRPSKAQPATPPPVASGAGRVNFHVDPDLHRRFKVYAASNDTTIKELLTDAMHQILDGR